MISSKSGKYSFIENTYAENVSLVVTGILVFCNIKNTAPTNAIRHSVEFSGLSSHWRQEWHFSSCRWPESSHAIDIVNILYLCSVWWSIQTGSGFFRQQQIPTLTSNSVQCMTDPTQNSAFSTAGTSVSRDAIALQAQHPNEMTTHHQQKPEHSDFNPLCNSQMAVHA